MKVNSKVVIIGLVVIIALLLSWSWLNEKKEPEVTNQDSLDNINLDDSPRIIINSPSFGALLNPGPTFISYTLSGNLEEVKRLDLMVLKKGGETQSLLGFFNKESKTGSQVISLTNGEYQLTARLVKNNESYSNTPFSETAVSFIVRETEVNK